MDSAANSEPRLDVGEEAPDFNVDTTDGRATLGALVNDAKEGVIVYFFPKAGTPGCTKEAVDFQDAHHLLKEAGYTVIGISPDSMAALEKFQAKQGLDFPLGSDVDHHIMERWGVWGTKKNYGRTYQGVIRSTFVINKEGRIALAQYNVRATGHVARLLKALGLAA